MKRFLIIAVALLAATGLLVGIGIFSLNSYIQNPKFIEEIRSSLSKMAGAEVKFQSLSVNVLRGAEIQRFQVQQPQNPKPPPFLFVDRIVLTYLPWKMLGENLELKKIELKKPQLQLRQSADGRWNIPTFDKTIPFLPGRDPLRLKLKLNDLEWVEGAMLALDSEENQIFRMQGANIYGNLDVAQTGAAAQGNVHILAMTLGNSLTFTDLQGPYTLANKILHLPEVYGKAHGGLMRGKLEADFGPGGQSFGLQIALEKVDVSTLLRDWGGRSTLASGKMNVEANLSGKLSQPRLLQGTGKMKIEACEITGMQALRILSEILGIPELGSAKFQAIQGDFKVGDQKLTFYNLEGISEKLQLTGTGSLGFDQTLDFDMMLALHPSLAEKIPPQLQSFFSERQDKYLLITFKVGGTLKEPETNLAKKLLIDGAQKELLTPLLEKFLKPNPAETPAPAQAPPAEAPAPPAPSGNEAPAP